LLQYVLDQQGQTKKANKKLIKKKNSTSTLTLAEIHAKETQSSFKSEAKLH